MVLAAPVWFDTLLEYPLMLIFVGCMGVYLIYRDTDLRRTFYPVRHVFPVVLISFAVFLGKDSVQQRKRSVFMDRSFFGSVRVELEHNNGIPIYSLMHGEINHGMQIQHERFKNRPTTYFTKESGVGRALLLKQAGKPSLDVGVIGLGIGTLAAYSRENDHFRMYEIDPIVIEIAGSSPWFSYLHDSDAQIEIIPGDGRLSLEHDLDISFDVLVLDAFSGDSPPAHLLTLEAFELYLNRLKKDGIIAVNISNRYLNLLPVLNSASSVFDLSLAYIQTKGDQRISADAQWVLLSRSDDFLNQPLIAAVNMYNSQAVRKVKPWTDHFSNLLKILK